MHWRHQFQAILHMAESSAGIPEKCACPTGAACSACFGAGGCTEQCPSRLQFRACIKNLQQQNRGHFLSKTSNSFTTDFNFSLGQAILYYRLQPRVCIKNLQQQKKRGHFLSKTSNPLLQTSISLSGKQFCTPGFNSESASRICSNKNRGHLLSKTSNSFTTDFNFSLGQAILYYRLQFRVCIKNLQ